MFNISYFLLIGIPTFLYYLDENSNFKSKYLKKGAVVFLILATTFRNGSGADLVHYANYYNSIKLDSIKNTMDIGYHLLNSFFAKLNAPFYIVLAIIASFNIIILYHFVEKNIKHAKWQALFCYLALFDIFIYSLSAIRQSIAISFLFISYEYIKKSNTRMVILFILLGSLFHWSFIFMLPIYIFYRFIYSKSASLLIIIISILTMLYPILMKLLALFPLNYNMDYYFNIQNTSITYSITSFIIYEILVILWVLYIKKIISINKTNINIKYRFKKFNQQINYMEYSTLLFLITKTWLTLSYNSGIARVQMYFYFFIPFVINRILNSFNVKYRYIFNIFLIILLTYMLYHDILINYEYYGYFKIFG